MSADKIGDRRPPFLSRLSYFTSLVKIPTTANSRPVLHPVAIPVGVPPILLQLSLQGVVPSRILLLVVGTRGVTKAIGILGLFIRGLSARGNLLFADGLFDRIINILIHVGFIATQ